MMVLSLVCTPPTVSCATVSTMTWQMGGRITSHLELCSHVRHAVALTQALDPSLCAVYKME